MKTIEERLLRLEKRVRKLLPKKPRKPKEKAKKQLMERWVNIYNGVANAVFHPSKAMADHHRGENSEEQIHLVELPEGSRVISRSDLEKVYGDFFASTKYAPDICGGIDYFLEKLGFESEGK